MLCSIKVKSGHFVILTLAIKSLNIEGLIIFNYETSVTKSDLLSEVGYSIHLAPPTQYVSNSW